MWFERYFSTNTITVLSSVFTKNLFFCCHSLTDNTDFNLLGINWPSWLGLQNTLTLFLRRCKILPTRVLWPNQLGLQNALTASLQRGKTPPTSVLDMTLNNLMVRAKALGNVEYPFIAIAPCFTPPSFFDFINLTLLFYPSFFDFIVLTFFLSLYCFDLIFLLYNIDFYILSFFL